MASPIIHLLILDFLDSYTYNLPQFLRTLDSDLSIDVKPYTALAACDVPSITSQYDGIVLSPGPGTVENPEDLGDFVPALLSHRPAIPIFGVCLGFQAICKHFGASIRKLADPHHGLISEIMTPDGRKLGRRATRYHSLEVVLPEEAREQLEVYGMAGDFFEDKKEGVMEVRHRTLPFWGVQYHPESVYSVGCEDAVRPFLAAVRQLRDSAKCDRHTSLQQHSAEPSSNPNGHSQKLTKEPISILWESLPTSADLLNILAATTDDLDFVYLDSGGKGRWSILSYASTARSFRYSLRKGSYTYARIQSPEPPIECGKAVVEDIWDTLKRISSEETYISGPPDVPFWGGFLGFFTYELGLAQLGVDPYSPNMHKQDQRYPIPDYDDIHLLWSTETMLYDSDIQQLYLISLNGDQSWLDWGREMINICAQKGSNRESQSMAKNLVVHPDSGAYCSDISTCQDQLRAGNSYELCLTATTYIHDFKLDTSGGPEFTHRRCNTVKSELTGKFADLRTANPASFMSLFQLGGVSFLSASPEEFLSFDALTNTAYMKPIKGTLSKSDTAHGPVNLEAAKKLLTTPKMIAENLMIVDLIRNDLSKVAKEVSCPKLLSVEELETLYHLVSTVKATTEDNVTAWDLLKCSLPPGSMTGAPKRRSCAILKMHERDGCRGLYSGIVGFIDVRGNCRTSVNIRNAARYPRESFWRVGAGGAITSLSDPQEEWEERRLKASSVMCIFSSKFDVLESMLWDPNQGLADWPEHFTRLCHTLNKMGFMNVFGMASSNPARDDRLSETLRNWIEEELTLRNQNSPLRVSLKVSAKGKPSLAVLPISGSSSRGDPVRVFADQGTIDAKRMFPFITHKTTFRTHYDAARLRVGAQGRDEVLIFRKPEGENEEDSGLKRGEHPNDDILTEGSYTNVAVFNHQSQKWITPSSYCLPGIEREKLVRDGKIALGEVRRWAIQPGTEVLLFNSVRGSFRGVVVQPPK